MKIKKSPEQLVTAFWNAHPDAIFTSKTVAPVLAMSESCLDKHRAAGRGPKFSKLMNSNIVYRKRDVVEFLESFEK